MGQLWIYISVFVAGVTVLLASPFQPQSSAAKGQCSEGKFRCDSICVSRHWRCDAILDCHDGADEKDCDSGDSNLGGEVTSSPQPAETGFRGKATTNTTKVTMTATPTSRTTSERTSETSVTSTTFTSTSTESSTREASGCSSDEFRCNDSSCIPVAWKCDGDPDCYDEEDEKDCLSCSSDEFRCNDSSCIPVAWKCDGDPDCHDEEDEKDCLSCPLQKFRCNDGECIYPEWNCDGDKDCSNGEDEQNCAVSIGCPSYRFRCNDNKCIWNSLKCDRANDCANGEDEMNCTTSTTSPTSAMTLDRDTKTPVRNTTLTSTSNESSTTEASACLSTEFQCNNGECLWMNWRCDGHSDCLNGEDETNCDTSTTTSTSTITLDRNTETSVRTTKLTFTPKERSTTEASRWSANQDSTTASTTEVVSTISSTNANTTVTTLPEAPLRNQDNCSDCNSELCSSCGIGKPSKCPPDFELLEDTCIWVNVFPRTWNQAKKICDERNATLLQFVWNKRFSIVQHLEEKFGSDGWIYWVALPKGNTPYSIFSSKRIPIPSWYLNGRTLMEADFPLTSDNCYFLNSTTSDVNQAITCKDYAGFICEAPANV